MLNLDSLLALPEMTGALVSPRGRLVVWSQAGPGNRASLFIAPTDGSTPPRAMHHTSRGTAPISWRSDESAVVVAHDVRGDERATLYLHSALAEGGEPRRLTEEAPSFFVRGGALHPVRDEIFYAADLPESQRAVNRFRIFRHDLRTERREPIVALDEGLVTAPWLSPSGDRLLFLVLGISPGGSELRITDLEGNGVARLTATTERPLGRAAWLDDRRIVFQSDTKTHTKIGLWLPDEDEVTWRLDEPERNIAFLIVPSNSSSFVVLEYRDARQIATCIDATTGSRRSFSPELGELTPLGELPNGSWVGLHCSARSPEDIVRVPSFEAMSVESLSNLWRAVDLEPQDFVTPESLSWRSVDGLKIQGWFYRTPERCKGTIIVAHPGPFAHARNAPEAMTQYLLARGFDVLAPNYRGSTGFGSDFRDAIKLSGCGGLEQQDIWSGIDALIRRGLAKAGSIGITGVSYGGYCAWCAATFGPAALAAAAPICGMVDLELDYFTTQSDIQPLIAELMGGTPEEVPNRFRERSPVHFLDRSSATLLVVQGKLDPNVTMEQFERARQALDKAGSAYETLVFEDEGHGVRRIGNRRVLYQRLADFFARTLDPAKQTSK